MWILSYVSCDPLFLLCLLGWCSGECHCSCSVPCQGKQMANRSSPLLAAGKTPSLPANFMLLCVTMVTLSQKTPAGSLCVSVWQRERERERRTNGQRASRRSWAVTLIYPRPSSSPVLFSSSSLFTILCPLPSGRPSSPNTVQLGSAVNVPPYYPPPFLVFVFVWMVVDLPLAPAWGSPFLLASLLNQTVCSLKWPITQIHRLEITRQLPDFNLSSNMNMVIK